MSSKDLTGMKFGRLTVLEFVGVTGGSHSSKIYHCKCECGKEKDVQSYLLTSKRVQSCGCLKRQRAKKVDNGNATVPSHKRKVAGVYHKGENTWQARIEYNHKSVYLGTFDSRELAVEARLEAELAVMNGKEPKLQKRIYKKSTTPFIRE